MPTKLLAKNEARIERMTGKKRHQYAVLTVKDTRILDQMMQCWTLRVKGYNLYTIGKQLGISTPTVTRRLQETKKLLDKQLLALKEDQTQILTDRLEWVYQEAAMAWDKSKTTSVTVLEDDSELVQANPGDPRFLLTALETLKTKQKLLGLGEKDKGVTVNVSVQQQVVEAISQRDRMNDIAKELQNLGIGTLSLMAPDESASSELPDTATIDSESVDGEVIE